MYDELLFTVCDIKRQVEKTLKDEESRIVDNMNEENRKGYDFGVKTLLTILENVIGVAEDGDCIMVNNSKLSKDIDYDECDLHDLLEQFDCRVVAQRGV